MNLIGHNNLDKVLIALKNQFVFKIKAKDSRSEVDKVDKMYSNELPPVSIGKDLKCIQFSKWIGSCFTILPSMQQTKAMGQK